MQIILGMHAQNFFSDRGTLPKHFETTVLESSPLMIVHPKFLSVFVSQYKNPTNISVKHA